MVIAGSPAEAAAIKAFRAELDLIVAGSQVDPEGQAAEGSSDDYPPSPKAGRRSGSDSPSPVRYQPTMRQMPTQERPRERLRERGPRYLNNAELVAILLRTGIAGENAIGVAMRILAEFQGLGGLARAGYADLSRQRGLSDAKTCEIMAALELGRRIASLAPEERAEISCPQDAANLVSAEMALLAQEHLEVLLLNTRNQVVARRTLYIGTVNSSAVRPAEVLRTAIRENAPSIIVVHNHPSGDPSPSPEDVAVTRDLVAAGKLMDIELLDHLVIGHGGRFVSMKQKRLGFA